MKQGCLAFVTLVLTVGCAARAPAPPPTLTSAEYAQVNASQRDFHRGAYGDALAASERALALAPEDPKAHYEHAAALAGVGRTDEAVAEFSRVEKTMGDAAWSRLALYGRARALDDAGRCKDARAAYEAYAARVRATDPTSAEIARACARACVERMAPAPEMTTIDAALMRGDNERALDSASARLATARTDRERAWLQEARAAALAALGRTGEAVKALDEAARALESAPDLRAERARVLYRKAHALASASRCAEATAAYAEYAAFARPFDPEGADAATRYAADCHK
jgi:tetratricopeptide (TPR) repeat protein